MNKRRILLRSFDILLCLLILVICIIPIFFFIVVKLLADGFPLFYNSKRIGKDGKVFTVYKFRSMVNDRNVIESYLNSIKSYGFEKITLDAVVYTKMGRFFEKFQIVEVLQIFNVLEGNMSLIGYRPLPQSRVIQLEEELGSEKVELRHCVKPGITGISQIIGKATLTNSQRVSLESSYNILVQSHSQLKVIFYNLLIIVETISQIFLKRHFFIKYVIREINNCHSCNNVQGDKIEISHYFPAYADKSFRSTFKSKRRSRIAS